MSEATAGCVCTHCDRALPIVSKAIDPMTCAKFRLNAQPLKPMIAIALQKCVSTNTEQSAFQECLEDSTEWQIASVLAADITKGLEGRPCRLQNHRNNLSK